jgi:hypothetical protein
MLRFRDFAAFGLSEHPPDTTPAYGRTRPTVHAHRAPSPRSAPQGLGAQPRLRGRGQRQGRQPSRARRRPARPRLRAGRRPGGHRLDRLSRSIADFAGMLDEAAKEKWRRLAVCSRGWSSSSPWRCPRAYVQNDEGMRRERQHRWSRAESACALAVDGPAPLWPAGVSGAGPSGFTSLLPWVAM